MRPTTTPPPRRTRRSTPRRRATVRLRHREVCGMNLDALLSALDNLPAAPAPGPAGSFAGPGLTSMEAELLDTIEQIFTERLTAVFPGWERRPQQIEMAKTVRLALARRKAALIEAGTGTGKSLALLAAAVEHSREMWMPVIVSTGTHVLQEQYLTKDVPVLQKAIGHFNVALAKGKANYLCLKRLDEETRQLAFDADDPMNQIDR